MSNDKQTKLIGHYTLTHEYVIVSIRTFIFVRIEKDVHDFTLRAIKSHFCDNCQHTSESPMEIQMLLKRFN